MYVVQALVGATGLAKRAGFLRIDNWFLRRSQCFRELAEIVAKLQREVIFVEC